MCIDLPVQWRTPVILQTGRADQYDDDMACNTTAYKKMINRCHYVYRMIYANDVKNICKVQWLN